MTKEILSLFKKDYVYLELKKKDTMALQDGLVGYIKVICYCCFAFPTHTISILN